MLEIPLLGRMRRRARGGAGGTERLIWAISPATRTSMPSRCGESIDDHICSGDLVLVESTQQVRQRNPVGLFWRAAKRDHAQAVLTGNRRRTRGSARQRQDAAHPWCRWRTQSRGACRPCCASTPSVALW